MTSSTTRRPSADVRRVLAQLAAAAEARTLPVDVAHLVAIEGLELAAGFHLDRDAALWNRTVCASMRLLVGALGPVFLREVADAARARIPGRARLRRGAPKP